MITTGSDIGAISNIPSKMSNSKHPIDTFHQVFSWQNVSAHHPIKCGSTEFFKLL
jgi:hypothetical protein